MAGQHGFARTLPWTFINIEKSSITCELSSNEATLVVWPHKFRLHYTATIIDSTLYTRFEVMNEGETPFEFTSLLHTYFRVPDICQIEVHGLKGLQYSDKLDNGRIHAEERDVIKIDSEIDRNYISFPNGCILKYPGAILSLNTNFSDLVLWNPWVEKAKSLADFGDDEYMEMICLEAGNVMTSHVLDPQVSWSSIQSLTINFD